MPKTQTKPRQEPVQAGDGEATARPTMSPAEVRSTSAGAGEAPSLEPPESAMAAEAVGAWQTGKTIGALWMNNSDRNVWVYVTGVGWRRLANNSASAVMTMNTLLSYAKQQQRTVNYHEYTNGLITECYVW